MGRGCAPFRGWWMDCRLRLSQSAIRLMVGAYPIVNINPSYLPLSPLGAECQRAFNPLQPCILGHGRFRGCRNEPQSNWGRPMPRLFCRLSVRLHRKWLCYWCCHRCHRYRVRSRAFLFGNRRGFGLLSCLLQRFCIAGFPIDMRPAGAYSWGRPSRPDDYRFFAEIQPTKTFLASKTCTQPVGSGLYGILNGGSGRFRYD